LNLLQEIKIDNFKAKIIRSNKREFDCLITETKEEVKAVCLREVLKKQHIVVGDNVFIRQQTNDERYEIYDMEERKNEIFRRIVRSNKKKVIASNTDLILIIAAVSKPDYKPFLIDRYITRSVQWGIPTLVIFNKMDQFENQFDIELEKKKFDHLGVNYFEISNERESQYYKNIDQLRLLLKDKTTICLGQSGVGKSRLITELSEGKVELLSSRLAKGIKKGAHTTTWAELLDLETFFMIDSPGVRTLAVSDISMNELPDLFPDIQPLFSQCQFTDCRHVDNSKGCYFNSLDLDKEHDYILYNRLVAFMRMRDEIEQIPEWKR
jgi:ribosome biogenesis GTPase